MSAGRYKTWTGVAKEPFAPSKLLPGKTVDALGNTVFDAAGVGYGGALLGLELMWDDYQAELAQAAALVSRYYAGHGFVFDVPPTPTPRRDVCTCGGQKFGGGTCSSWCDSSAARAQHSEGGAS